MWVKYLAKPQENKISMRRNMLLLSVIQCSLNSPLEIFLDLLFILSG